MTDPSFYGLKPRREGRARIGVGEVLADVFSVITSYWPAYYGLSLLLAAFGLAALAKPHVPPADLKLFAAALLVVRTAISFVGQAAITYATVKALEGAPFSLGAGLKVALRRILPYIGAAIVAALIVGFGMLLLIVPGIIVMLTVFIALAVVLVERQGPIGSLKRSREMTRGNRWRILAVGLVIVLIPVLVFVAIGILAAARHLLTPAQLPLLQIITAAANVLLTPLYFALLPVLYHHLRRAEGSIGRANVAEVFA